MKDKINLKCPETFNIPVTPLTLKGKVGLNGRSFKKTSARDHFNKGLASLNQGKSDLAYLCFSKAISTEPNWEYYSHRARSHMCFNNYEGAKKDLENAILNASSQPLDTILSLYFAFASVEHRLKNHRNALSLVNELLTDPPAGQLQRLLNLKVAIEGAIKNK